MGKISFRTHNTRFKNGITMYCKIVSQYLFPLPTQFSGTVLELVLTDRSNACLAAYRKPAVFST